MVSSFTPLILIVLQFVDSTGGSYHTLHTTINATTSQYLGTPTPATTSNSFNFTAAVRPPAASPTTVIANNSTTPLALGAVVGILTVLLLIVTTGWVCTCWTINRKKNMEEGSSQNTRSCENTDVATTLNLNNNPAYESQTPLQKNLAYDDTALTISKPEESQALTNTAGPTYETIPLDSGQPASDTICVLSSRQEDEYDKLNRDI